MSIQRKHLEILKTALKKSNGVIINEDKVDFYDLDALFNKGYLKEEVVYVVTSKAKRAIEKMSFPD
jgi:hypothetical protein